jgi:hypothetical protein
MVMVNPDDIRTSWNAPKFGDYRARGRTGYSVKFVSFKTLQSKDNKMDGSASWTNAFDMDGETEADIGSGQLQH